MRPRYRSPVATGQLNLPFDPIERAAETWRVHFGPSSAMAAVTSIMRAHQILLSQLDTLLKPYDLTFARYEALVLLTFSKTGALPLWKIGERLMVASDQRDEHRGPAGACRPGAPHAAIPVTAAGCWRRSPTGS